MLSALPSGEGAHHTRTLPTRKLFHGPNVNVFVARQLRVNVSKGINIHIFIYALQTLQLAESGHTAICNVKACKHVLRGCFVV